MKHEINNPYFENRNMILDEMVAAGEMNILDIYKKTSETLMERIKAEEFNEENYHLEYRAKIDKYDFRNNVYTIKNPKHRLYGKNVVAVLIRSCKKGIQKMVYINNNIQLLRKVLAYAVTIDACGYYHTRKEGVFKSVNDYLHRAVYRFYFGEKVEASVEQIDHDNQHKEDNYIENLKPSNARWNTQNKAYKPYGIAGIKLYTGIIGDSDLTFTTNFGSKDMRVTGSNFVEYLFAVMDLLIYRGDGGTRPFSVQDLEIIRCNHYVTTAANKELADEMWETFISMLKKGVTYMEKHCGDMKEYEQRFIREHEDEMDFDKHHEIRKKLVEMRMVNSDKHRELASKGELSLHA